MEGHQGTLGAPSLKIQQATRLKPRAPFCLGSIFQDACCSESCGGEMDQACIRKKVGLGFSIAVSSQVSAIAFAHLPGGPSRRHHGHMVVTWAVINSQEGPGDRAGLRGGASLSIEFQKTSWRRMLGQTPAELSPLVSPPNHDPPKFYFCPWLLTGMCVCVPFRTLCPQTAIA